MDKLSDDDLREYAIAHRVTGNHAVANICAELLSARAALEAK